MRILVTGGTGVVGQAAVEAIVARGETVRLLSRHASTEAEAWPHRVEAIDGSVTEPEQIRGAATDCDVVLHLAGIVDEDPPESTFAKVNVEGTRLMVREAERAGVRRFIYVSSLGADRGQSEYHKSKRQAEEIVHGFAGEWSVLRPGNVYGPGDEVISLLLKMIRTLPAIPVIDGGEHEFQPIWAGDLGEALARAIDHPDIVGRTLDLAGPDRTTMNDLIDRFVEITARKPMRVSVTGSLVSLGAKLGETLGFDLPINDSQIKMLEEGNLIDIPAHNALIHVFQVTPTSLEDGLRKLADALPEQLPDDGFGGLKRRHVWVDIVGSRLSAAALFARFRERFSEITPWHLQVGAEPGTAYQPGVGETMTMKLPVRGNIQVRIEELTPTSLTLCTLEGHPLAGAVNFRCRDRDDGTLRFEVRVFDRASNVADWLIMSTVGSHIQRETWKSIAERVVEESGGTAPDGVHHESSTLTGESAEPVEEWMKELVVKRKREEREASV